MISTNRNPIGVKVRADGQGDAWADSHRDFMRSAYMLDIDGLVGFVGFAANTGEKLFIEYVPDDYSNHRSEIRTFATVAMFDRKSSRSVAFAKGNQVSRAYYLDICRKLAATQPKPPRFFYVLGRDCPPWEMVELDIETAEEIGTHTIESLDTGHWRHLWHIMGLGRLRSDLRRWIES